MYVSMYICTYTRTYEKYMYNGVAGDDPVTATSLGSASPSKGATGNVALQGSCWACLYSTH
jgi:hypothetical protein